MCAEIGIALAPNCLKKEKAFANETCGKVLGIIFNTVTLTWSLPNDIKHMALTAVCDGIQSPNVSLLQLQKLAGRLTDIFFMCSFLLLVSKVQYSTICA